MDKIVKQYLLPLFVGTIFFFIPLQSSFAQFTVPKKYYLALGDSFAFGYHKVQFDNEISAHNFDPKTFNSGYDADFFRDMLGQNSQMQEINYSCPGETTTTFSNGGCPNHNASWSIPLHTDYPISISQLQAAYNFLAAHPGEVSPITINIGANDALNLQAACYGKPDSCYTNTTTGTPHVLATIQKNYDRILYDFQKIAPQAEIIIAKTPLPLTDYRTADLENGIDQIQENEAASRHLKIADTYSIFNQDTIPTYTNYYSTPSDFHPNDYGYLIMSRKIWYASGF